MRRRRLRALAVFALLIAGVPAAAFAESGVLRVGVPSVPASLDPGTELEGSAALIARQVFDTLTQYREGTSDIEPGLATQWTVSRDGLLWTFRLRDGVRFHDGTPLTAHHVVDALERLVQPTHPFAPNPNAAPRLVRGAPGVIREIRAVDPRTVQIGVVLPYAPLLTILAHPAFSIAFPGAGSPRWQGTGPFRIAEVASGQMALEANPAYWGGAPRTGRIVFVETADEAKAAQALDAQQLDILIPAGMPPRLNGALSVPGWRVGYLALQTEKEPFRRVRVRRAIAAALDARALGPALGAAAVPLQGFLPPGVWGRREGVVSLEGNAEAAKRLLAEAGFPRGAAATLLLAEWGRGVDSAQLAEAIRAGLGAAGIGLTIQVETPEAALGLAQVGDHEIALLEARADAGDPHFLLYPLSSSEGAVKGPGALNMSFYRNARADDLLIRGSQVSFRPERLRIYGRAQALLAGEMPWIPLYTRLNWAVVRPELRGFRLHPSGNHRLDRAWVDVAPPTPLGGR